MRAECPTTEAAVSRRLRTVGIVIHHSGVQNGPKGPAALKQFERTHMDTVAGTPSLTTGWSMRTGDLPRSWPCIVGGATRGWNSKTESICYTGWGSDPLSPEAMSHEVAGRSPAGRVRLEALGETARLCCHCCPGGWLGARWKRHADRRRLAAAGHGRRASLPELPR